MESLNSTLLWLSAIVTFWVNFLPDSEGQGWLYDKTPVVVRDTFPATFGIGRAATPVEIARLDIDVRPDGKGLPPGEGKPTVGKLIFAQKCAACHGVGGVGGPNESLVTTASEGTKKRPEKTVGNYWPYATTVFDYIRRAMPFSEPGSLTNEEVYNLTAYLLTANGIIDEKAVINAQTLFVPDDWKGGPEIK
ncbi:MULTISPECIES: cytochrome c [unclassified Spirosoma]|uniref:c-type cytochrome n=1 Tax=unclassified Spirosoma TaxID=2621999 RepID=UPI000AB90689|nr:MULTISPECIES: cytochrome c [unclassified Spirosoma]MBN8825971.1 cytochrome c [Spirosoma sp.]